MDRAKILFHVSYINIYEINNKVDTPINNLRNNIIRYIPVNVDRNESKVPKPEVQIKLIKFKELLLFWEFAKSFHAVYKPAVGLPAVP